MLRSYSFLVETWLEKPGDLRFLKRKVVCLEDKLFRANEDIASVENKGLYGCGLYMAHTVRISLLFLFFPLFLDT